MMFVIENAVEVLGERVPCRVVPMPLYRRITGSSKP